MKTRNIMQVTDEQLESDRLWYNQERKNNLERMERAFKVAKQLGLAGFWRGHYAAIRIIYEALMMETIKAKGVQ